MQAFYVRMWYEMSSFDIDFRIVFVVFYEWNHCGSLGTLGQVDGFHEWNHSGTNNILYHLMNCIYHLMICNQMEMITWMEISFHNSCWISTASEYDSLVAKISWVACEFYVHCKAGLTRTQNLYFNYINRQR